MKKVEFKDIDSARKALGLENSFSINDIKEQYYILAKTHHPDKNKNKKAAENKFAKINDAYSLLMEYAYNHKISCNENDFLNENIDLKCSKQFHDGWY